MRRLLISGIFLLFAALACASTVRNLKYDVAQERIVISCRDHQPPAVRVLNPNNGPIVVVDCEREK